MKKLLLTLVFFAIYLVGNSQNTSVEASVFGVQIGYLGIYGNYEARLSNSIALRSEIGLALGNNFDNTQYFGSPEITIEPRWYYNLKRRAEKGKSITNNSSNFVSLRTKYRPDLILFGNDDFNFINDFSIATNWGIRRNIGEHINYEAGIGIIYIKYLKESIHFDYDLSIDLHVRIGYSF